VNYAGKLLGEAFLVALGAWLLLRFILMWYEQQKHFMRRATEEEEKPETEKLQARYARNMAIIAALAYCFWKLLSVHL
jgi:hypothetical protein